MLSVTRRAHSGDSGYFHSYISALITKVIPGIFGHFCLFIHLRVFIILNNSNGLIYNLQLSLRRTCITESCLTHFNRLSEFGILDVDRWKANYKFSVGILSPKRISCCCIMLATVTDWSLLAMWGARRRTPCPQGVCRE